VWMYYSMKSQTELFRRPNCFKASRELVSASNENADVRAAVQELERGSRIPRCDLLEQIRWS
jgi:hypothetical protein